MHVTNATTKWLWEKQVFLAQGWTEVDWQQVQRWALHAADDYLLVDLKDARYKTWLRERLTARPKQRAWEYLRYEQIEAAVAARQYPSDALRELRAVAEHDYGDLLALDRNRKEYRDLLALFGQYRQSLRTGLAANVPTGEKLWRFWESIKKDGVKVFLHAGDPEVRRRMAICAGCRYFATANFKCVICGCGYDNKLRSASMSCPIFVWDLAAGATLTPEQAVKRQHEIDDAEKKYHGRLTVPLTSEKQDGAP